MPLRSVCRGFTLDTPTCQGDPLSTASRTVFALWMGVRSQSVAIMAGASVGAAPCPYFALPERFTWLRAAPACPRPPLTFKKIGWDSNPRRHQTRCALAGRSLYPDGRDDPLSELPIKIMRERGRWSVLVCRRPQTVPYQHSSCPFAPRAAQAHCQTLDSFGTRRARWQVLNYDCHSRGLKRRNKSELLFTDPKTGSTRRSQESVFSCGGMLLPS